MNSRDPKLIALLFNECINNQNIEGLTSLMTEDHTFIDHKREIDEGKESMIKGWKISLTNSRNTKTLSLEWIQRIIW